MTRYRVFDFSSLRYRRVLRKFFEVDPEFYHYRERFDNFIYGNL